MGKDVYYFQHDYEPLNDPKLLALIGEYGAAAYGVYWRIVEMLHSENEHMLQHEKYIYAAIAKQMSTPVEQVESIIEYCISFCKLFQSDGLRFWSERVFRNIEKRDEVSEKRRKAGKASAEARQKSKNNEQQSTNVEHVLNHVKQNPTKEIKEKEIKEKEKKEVITPEAREVNFKNSVFSFSEKYEVKMLESFLNYWAEWNQKKTKMKFELQTTFEISKRLATWAANQIKFDNKKNTQNGTQFTKAASSNGFSRPGYDPNNGIGDGTRLSDKKRPTIFSSESLRDMPAVPADGKQQGNAQ